MSSLPSLALGTAAFDVCKSDMPALSALFISFESSVDTDVDAKPSSECIFTIASESVSGFEPDFRPDFMSDFRSDFKSDSDSDFIMELGFGLEVCEAPRGSPSGRRLDVQTDCRLWSFRPVLCFQRG